MNTILLADDDQYVLDGLLKHIPWAEMGVRIVGTAGDGAEAWRKFQELKPDIVFTDVYMPEMDGFQLTACIHEVDPNFPVVILSGYDDFANARKAVKSGIQHFLLKPPSLAEIEFVVREVVQQLNESNERDALLSSYTEQQEVLQRSMREAFFREMLVTRYRPEELPQQRISFLSLPEAPDVQVLCLSLVRSDIWSKTRERDWQLLRFGTGNIIREVLNKRLEGSPQLRAELLDYTDKEFIVAFLGEEAGKLRPSFILELSTELIEQVLQYMRISMMGGLGSMHAGYHRVMDSFLEARHAVEMAEMGELNRIYLYEEGSEAEHGEHPAMPLDTIRKLHDAIFRKQLQQAQEYWQLLRADNAEGAYSLPVLKGVYAGLISALWTTASTAAYSVSDGAGLEEQMRALQRCGSTGQLIDWMDEQIERLAGQIKEELQGKKSHAIVDRVIKEYIEKCYDKNITLEEIAAQLHVNRNYLSQLFKKITGEPFVTYINKYRIHKAKELMMSGNYMVYEVSELVGFQNSTYFSQVFKSITGYSPSEHNR